MHSLWQQITLSTLPLSQWRQTSYLNRLVGSLQTWRQNSWFLQWADPIGAILISIALIAAPFTSTTIIGWLLAAGIAYWILLTLSDTPQPESAGMTPIHLLLLLFWSISAIAAAFSPLKVLAFGGLGKLTLYLLFFVFMARVFRSATLRSWVLGVYLHVALIVSGQGIRQYFFGAPPLATWVDAESPLANVTRVYSFLGNPNLLAAYVIPAIAFSIAALFAWRRWLPKLLALTMAIVHTTCLMMTQSRGGWIAVVVMALAVFLLLYYWWSPLMPSFWRVSALPLLAGGLIVAVVLGYVLVPAFRYRIASMGAGNRDSSNAFRMNVWAAAFEMIQDYPVLGIGPGDGVFKKIYPLYQRARFSALSAYSVLLDVAVETGILGLTTFLWFLLATFYHGGRQLRSLRDQGDSNGFWLIGALVLMVGLLSQGMVDTVWARPEVNILWWMGIAVVASFYQRRSLAANAPTLATDAPIEGTLP